MRITTYRYLIIEVSISKLWCNHDSWCNQFLKRQHSESAEWWLVVGQLVYYTLLRGWSKIGRKQTQRARCSRFSTHNCNDAALAQRARRYYRCYRYQRNGVNVQQYERRSDFSRCAMEYLARMPVEHGGGLLSNQTEKPHHYTWASVLLLFLPQYALIGHCLSALFINFPSPPITCITAASCSAGLVSVGGAAGH